MSVIPVVRHFIACKKPPTMNGADPTVHDILHAIRPKAPFKYPVWHPTFYLFAMVTDGRGVCEFRIEMRLVRLNSRLQEAETIIGESKSDRCDLGNQPLAARILSIEMPSVLLPQAGVYRLYLICNGEELAVETSSRGSYEQSHVRKRPIRADRHTTAIDYDGTVRTSPGV